MEGLLYSSSSPIHSSKIHHKHSHFAPLTRVDSLKLGSTRLDSRQLGPRSSSSLRSGSVTCKHEEPPPYLKLQKPFDKIPSLLTTDRVNSPPVEPVDSSLVVKRVQSESSQKKKAISTGTFVLLSALIVALIHPLFASPAFATFQNAAKTGVPAAAAAVGTKLVRTELLSSAWTGFFAGCLHTLSGPDHLVALAPLSIGRSKMESAAVGALWGFGHDAGQVLFGLLFLLLKDQLHIEVLSTWGTRIVGLTLLVIGALGIREASEAQVPAPCVALENGECDVSMYEKLETPVVGKKKKFGFATFATGIIHGLQPDALMMVLPALALPSRIAGAAFLVMFLVGTVVAMGSYTVFIGSCSRALKERMPRITEKLTWASSLAAIGLGLSILISQAFGYNLY